MDDIRVNETISHNDNSERQHQHEYWTQVRFSLIFLPVAQNLTESSIIIQARLFVFVYLNYAEMNISPNDENKRLKNERRENPKWLK